MSSPYMMLPGSRLYIEGGKPMESLGFVSGPPSGPPGPLSNYTSSGACCSSCEQGGPCASGDFTGGVGGLLMLGLAVFGGYCLWKKYK